MLPSTCLGINQEGHLTIGGIDTMDLVKEYGTAIYVMDENLIRENCQKYVDSFKRHYNGFGCPIYATKAFCCKEICKIVESEGLDMDSVSLGEMYTAICAGVNPSKIHFHGNNKTFKELTYAVENNIGDIVADSFVDIETIDEISGKLNKVTNVSLRIKPGIDAHTHEFVRTGKIDSKFGFALETGEALEAVRLALSKKNINLISLHCHIGSQIFDIEPFVLAAQVMLDFYGEIKTQFGVELPRLNLGGGFGIKYLENDDAVPYENYMTDVSKAVHEKCAELNFSIPKIYIEPGRSIVGEAGITLYTIGNIKEIPTARNYVSIDGGMCDNPRYALYQASYTCLIANKANEEPTYKATIAGKCCESGDLIQEHTMIAQPEIGDILAVLSTGAYNHSMSSTYNKNGRLPCIMIKDGKTRVVVKGDSLEDLIRNDM